MSSPKKSTSQGTVGQKLVIDSQASQSSVDSGAGELVPKAVLDMGFKLGPQLGEGGFSKVYKATSSKPNLANIPLACKRFDLTKVEHEVWRDKCLKQEMKIMLKLKHPNIVPAYDVVKTRKAAFIFMKYCKNGSVADYLTKNAKPIDERRAKKWFSDILNAVAHLHSKNIAHRDIKPENFLLDNDYKDAMLTDFGFSCMALDNERLMKGTTCGTDAYKAPEILSLKEGHVYDPKRADIWAMGVSLFEMLNLNTPFGDTNDRNTIKKQMNRSYNYNKNSKLSQNAQNCCNLLLEPKADKRVTAKEVKTHIWFKED